MSKYLGDTTEEHKDREKRVKNHGDKTEPDIWGIGFGFTQNEAHDLMFDRLPDVREFVIPREVMERIDLPMSAKLIYGVLNAFPSGCRWRQSEIAGLCGISTATLGTSLMVLEDRGLLKREREKKHNGNMPSAYYLIEQPSRFDHFQQPKFLSNDISNIEEELKSKFYGL